MFHITVPVSQVIPVQLTRKILEDAKHWVDVCGKKNLPLSVVTGFALHPYDRTVPGKRQVGPAQFRVNCAMRTDSAEEGTRTYVLRGRLNDAPATLTAIYYDVWDGPDSEEPDYACIE